MKNYKYKDQTKRHLGQVTLEYILLAVLLVALFQITINVFKNNGYLEKFSKTPNAIFVNLIENGNWKLTSIDSKAQHPNHYKLHFSAEGEGP